jgi:hypothetical protein
MQTLGTTVCSRRSWLAVLAVCGLAIGLAIPSADAQGGRKPLGAVMGIPIGALGPIIGANVLQNNVNVLGVTQTAIGNFNTQIATISVTQKNNAGGAGPVRVLIPRTHLAAVQQFNNNETVVNQTAVGAGNTQVADVAFTQSNQTYLPGKTRFLFAPASAVPAIVQNNSNTVALNQLAIGDANTQIATIAVDQSNSAAFKVPASALGAISQLNSNVVNLNQTAVGSGNTQVAVIGVNQNNN